MSGYLLFVAVGAWASAAVEQSHGGVQYRGAAAQDLILAAIPLVVLTLAWRLARTPSRLGRWSVTMAVAGP